MNRNRTTETEDHSPDNRVRSLIESAKAMEYGSARIAIVEEAVRLSDLTNDLDLRYSTRELAVEANNFGGQPDLALIHFSWLVAQHDANPDRFDERSLLWKYKWISSRMSIFPHISGAKIMQTLDDMERRYRIFGEGLHAMHQIRRAVAIDLGDFDVAKEEHNAASKSKRDGLSNCSACVLNADFDFFMAMNDRKTALKTVKPILDGHLHCTVVPHSTYALVLHPLLSEKKGEEAMEYHRKGYKLVQRNPGHIYSAGLHMSFLALTDNLSRAVSLLQRHFPVALAHINPNARLDFLERAWITLDRLLAADKKKITLRLPPDSPIFKPDGKFGTEELRDWLEDEITKLNRQYDLRNGNESASKNFKKLRKIDKYATPIPYKS